MYSAWWGESFVTELRRISEAPDRKVHFANVTVTGPEDSAKTAGEKVSELPIRSEADIKDRESDPAAAATNAQ
jgi:hypothetical protein